MRVAHGELQSLTQALRERTELGYKRDVRGPARVFGRDTQTPWFPETGRVRNGDDATALALVGRGSHTLEESGPEVERGSRSARPSEYILFAAEGIRGELVASDPWFAGYASVLANVNDIAAMGGRPWAVVDVLFMGSGDNERVLRGMAAASDAYGVPVVGGHTTRTTGPSMLAVSVIGRATRLLPSDGARPGHALIAAVDLGGAFRGSGGNFDASTASRSEALRCRLEVLPQLAELGLARAAKDISMAGLCGTILMMLEAAACGAAVDLSRVPAPFGVDCERWLTAFPSFGFVMAAEHDATDAVCAAFDRVGVAAAVIGEVVEKRALDLECHGERATYWDLEREPLTGLGG
jgi:AIR synthase-related protein